MKALLLVDEPGDKIKIKEVEKPRLQQGQALVRVKAAALNHRDQWCRENKYPSIKYNVILGSDGAGVVEEVFDPEDKFWLSKEVIINPNINWGTSPDVQQLDYKILGMPNHGTFAEYVAVGIDRLVEKPSHLDFAQASALPLGGLTAFRALFTHGKVKEGHQVLISGIGGGVAQFAFLFALQAGAKLSITSSSESKLAKVVGLGAVFGFNYNDKDWHKEAYNKSRGYNLIIDSAGGNQVNTFIKILKPAGKIVFYGATNGLPTSLDMYRLFWNQGTIQGSTMGSDAEFMKMTHFVKEHKIVPIIDSVRPFKDIVSAFDDMREGKQLGKLVVEL